MIKYISKKIWDAIVASWKLEKSGRILKTDFLAAVGEIPTLPFRVNGKNYSEAYDVSYIRVGACDGNPTDLRPEEWKPRDPIWISSEETKETRTEVYTRESYLSQESDDQRRNDTLTVSASFERTMIRSVTTETWSIEIVSFNGLRAVETETRRTESPWVEVSVKRL